MIKEMSTAYNNNNNKSFIGFDLNHYKKLQKHLPRNIIVSCDKKKEKCVLVRCVVLVRDGDDRIR